MTKKIYDDLTGHISRLYNKMDYFQSKIDKEQSKDKIESLTNRLEATKIKYDKYINTLKKYIGFIPSERTKECIELRYIENWTKEDISDYYHIDLSVITRELICGRQIITALEKYDKGITM